MDSDTTTHSLINEQDEDLLVEAKDQHLDDLVQEEDLEIIEDENVNKFKKNLIKNKRKLVILLALTVVLLLGLVAATIIVVPTVVVLVRVPLPPTPDYEQPEDIRYSAEYQIALDPKESWNPREPMIVHWINSMNEFANGTIVLRREDAIESMYLAWHMPISKCNTDDAKLRIRNYVSGPKTGQVTVDIKKDGDSYKDVLNLPYWPGEEFKNRSTEKLEKDVHPCFGKYALETRLFLNYVPQINKCKDIQPLFPGILYKCSEDEMSKKLSNETQDYYYNLQWSGKMLDASDYQITFEIQYFQNLARAASGNQNIYDGEWSIRLFAVNGSTFDQASVDFTDNFFYKLVQRYDQYPNHVDCAKRYLGGERNQYMGLGKFQ